MGWADLSTQDGSNFLRSRVYAIHGVSPLPGGGAWPIAPLARLEVEGEVLTEFAPLPNGRWTDLSGEVPYRKEVPDAAWPLGDSSRRRAMLVLRPARQVAPASEGPACLVRKKTFIRALETGAVRRGLAAQRNSRPTAPVSFVARPLFGEGRALDDPRGLSAYLGAGPLWVVEVGRREDEDGGITELLVRPERLERTIHFQGDLRGWGGLATLCDPPGPRLDPPILESARPPVVLVRSWETDFLEETIDDLIDHQRLQKENGTVQPGGAISDGDRVVRVVVDREKRTGLILRRLGWIRFEGASRIVSALDANWKSDDRFGVTLPGGEPLVVGPFGHLEDDGTWRPYFGGPVWPRATPSNMIMGTADLPRVTLTYPVFVPALGREIHVRGNSWQVDRAGGGAYATYSDPVYRYRYRVGLTAERDMLLADEGVPFDLTLEPSPGGGCYRDDVAQRREVRQVRLDQIEVMVANPAGRGGTRWIADAGEVLLDRPGPVGLPYLTESGALPVGTDGYRATVLEVIEKGTEVSVP